MSELTPLLEMNDIEKSFNGVQVLKKVNLDIGRGEVHALMGENGAGKSTLIKILTGVYPKDGGRICINGKECEINSRSDASAQGIGVIYQELSLIPTLSVAQNIMLGREPNVFGIVRSKAIQKTTEDLIRRYAFELRASDIVETLSIAKRQMVEILKALSEESVLIIMDEPTASLSVKESESLFSIIRQLRETGVSILYISHRLEEVFRLADRLTILRDGNKVATLNKDEINPQDVIRMMIGKDLSESTATSSLRKPQTPPLLTVNGLTRKGFFSDISFTLHEGEILGIGGLVGSGRTEVMRCLYGADHYDSGSIEFEGKRVTGSVSQNISRGFALVPEDRRRQGFVPLLSSERNIALSNYDMLSSFSVVNRAEERKMAVDTVSMLDIRPGNPHISVGNLSGGNQQKVVLGKWLKRDLKVLLIDEPTAGIDVGAKDEIYKIIEDLAASGVGIILVSSDLQELLRVSHRILVFRKGHVFHEFDSGVITQEDVLMAASGIDMGGGSQ